MRAVAVLLGLWYGYRILKDASQGTSPKGVSPDPRLTYAGPFLNIHPDVDYVGDARCAECHSEIARTYREHPMGRSLRPMAEVASPEVHSHHHRFEALGRRFEVDQRKGVLWHRQSSGDTGERDLQVNYVIGSGTRGHSYLTNHDGYVFQTPISWYSQKRIWELSPGFHESSLPERPVPGACLFCHANRANFDQDSENRYRTPTFTGHAIGCERCHGPGERHIQAAGRQRDAASGRDLSIVNPAVLNRAAKRYANNATLPVKRVSTAGAWPARLSPRAFSG